MKAMCRLAALALGLVLGAQAGAQTPLFLDGTAFGGSKVFSEGLNPLGNPSRFDQPQPQPALCLTILEGDQRSQDNAEILDALGVGGPAVPATSDLLRRLSDSPWALRTRSFGAAYLTSTANLSASHEDFHSVLATTDGNPVGATTLDVRRSAVDRATIGIGSMEQGTAFGFSLRLERWQLGTRTQYLNASGSQLSFAPDPWDFNDLSRTTVALALDCGFIYEPFPGLRLGGTVDRLNQKHLWDVYERPQGRLGVQLDIGSAARLSVESDVNAAARMPFPVPQRTAAASLRVAPNTRTLFTLGLERRKIGAVASLTAGASLRFRPSPATLGFGFQAGQERPMKGLMMVVD